MASFLFKLIKVGSNGSFNASTGFDLCTGLGSIAGDILALNLVQNTVSVSGILIDYSSINLVAGKQIRVTAQIIPPNATNKGVSWSSSNSLVATVRKTACPLVRPNYNPDCDDSIDRYTDSCFEDFTPDCDDRYYDFGNVIDQDILQNPTLACDSIGLITAFVSGTTTITAKSDDGMFTASTTVTVTGVIVKVTGVTLNTAFLSLNVGDVNQLQATVSPQNATNKSVTWSASSNIITISNTVFFHVYDKLNRKSYASSRKIIVRPVRNLTSNDYEYR